MGQLASQLPISRPAVSQHLRVLKDAGLVRDRAVGTRRLYDLDTRGPADVRAYLDHYWSSTLAAFAEAVAEDALQRNSAPSAEGDTPTREDPQ